MEWLLKIVEGPMKGAEIALVEGVTVAFGSGDDCDIVVRDATVPARACEFVSDATGVRIAVGGGAAEPLPSFEVRSFGTTSFAVGPVSGEWLELLRPARAVASESAPPAAPAAVPAPAPASEEEAPPSCRRAGCLLVTLLLLVLAAVLVWLFWPWLRERGRILANRPSASPAAVSVIRLPLSEIARQHGLSLTNGPTAAPLLVGNLRRRTERLAVRALALASDPSVRFDLTDDETLLASSSELVFACSDGALKVDAAADRSVTLSGYAPSFRALESALRALNADVRGIEKVDTSRVRIGGAAPEAVAKTPFVREELPGERPVVAIPAHTPEPAAARRDYPIAGILTAPYPCVVMRSGLRLVEGAQIGEAVLVKIEADRLLLQEGSGVVEWRP